MRNSYRLLALVTAVTVLGAMNVEAQEPRIFSEIRPDASNIFDEADQVNLPFDPLVQVTGELSGGQDADIYNYLPSNWSLPVLVSVWISAFQHDGTSDGAGLYSRSNNDFEYSYNSYRSNSSLARVLLGAEQELEMGVFDTGTSDAPVLFHDPDRLEPDDSGNSFTKSYVLMIDEPRPHQSIVELDQFNERDASRITATTDCSANLLTWRYQDLDPSVINEVNEQIYSGVKLLPPCLQYGFQFRSQAIIGVVVMNPVTGFVYLGREYDPDDPHPIGETSQFFEDWAPVIRPGELAALVPASDPDPVLLMGTIVFDSNGLPILQSGCNTCLRNFRSAHPVKNSIVGIEIINPRVDFDLGQLTITEIPGEDSLEVTLPVASSDQIFAFDLSLVRLQDGNYTSTGEVIASDTMRVITPANAVNRLHTESGYTLTKRLPIRDLRPGDQIRIEATPVGRGLYNDTTSLAQFAQLVEYVMQAGTPVDDVPEPLEFASSIYPNPSNGDQVTLAVTSGGGEVSYAVYDVRGRQVMSGSQIVSSGGTDIPLDLQGVAPGVYAYRVQELATGTVVNGRLTVIR